MVQDCFVIVQEMQYAGSFEATTWKWQACKINKPQSWTPTYNCTFALEYIVHFVAACPTSWFHTDHTMHKYLHGTCCCTMHITAKVLYLSQMHKHTTCNTFPFLMGCGHWWQRQYLISSRHCLWGWLFLVLCLLLVHCLSWLVGNIPAWVRRS